ncbi:hypothetical protein HMPREF9137_0801 [Prevotella denticola F0289]|nr:hypothetical protein HMPREF9137_0801 [Prevotella denticola F0289]
MPTGGRIDRSAQMTGKLSSGPSHSPDKVFDRQTGGIPFHDIYPVSK